VQSVPRGPSPANITGPSPDRSSVPQRLRVAYDANASEFRIPEISRRGSPPLAPPVAFRCPPPPDRRLPRSDISDHRSRWYIVVGPSLCRRAHLYAAPRYVGICLLTRDGFIDVVGPVRGRGYAGSWVWTSENTPSETVWKIAGRPLEGALLAPGGANRLLFAPSWRPYSPRFGTDSEFPNSFSTHLVE
jgi:hypothetical protein